MCIIGIVHLVYKVLGNLPYLCKQIWEIVSRFQVPEVYRIVQQVNENAVHARVLPVAR